MLSAPTATVRAADFGGSPHVLHFKLLHGQDQLMRQEAYRLLVPAGWKAAGGVEWRNVAGHLATAVLRVTSPDGLRQVEVLPEMPFVDGVREKMMKATRMAGPATERLMAEKYAEGRLYYGSEVRRCVEVPATFVREFVLPRHRRSLPGLRIVNELALPVVAKNLMRLDPGEALAPNTYHVGKTRIEFSGGGQIFDEDVYCVLKFTDIKPSHLINWSGEHLLAIRAPKGQLDTPECGRIFDTITHSFRIDIHWLSKYMQVQMWMIKQKIKETEVMSEASRRWAQTSSQVTDDMMKTWENRQAVTDAENVRFDQHIRDVDEYTDANGNHMELPAGGRAAWMNGSGDYIVSDNTLFNPNVDLKDAGNWSQMRLVQH